MVAITQVCLTGLSVAAMARHAIAAPIIVESDSLAVRGTTSEEEIFQEKRATGKLPKPVQKVGQAAIKVASKLPGKKHLKNAAIGAEKKAIKAASAVSKAKNKIGNKRGLEEYYELEAREYETLSDLIARDIIDAWDAEVFESKRATGKLPKPVQKVGQAAIKVASKLPGKKHLKNAAIGAEKKAVKAASAVSKAKNKIGNKRSTEELAELEARATGKLPKPVRKLGQAAIKVASKLPGKKHIKNAAVGAEKKAVKAASSLTKAKAKVGKKVGSKRDLGDDYDFEVRDFDDDFEVRDFDNEFETRDFDDELEVRDASDELEWE